MKKIFFITDSMYCGGAERVMSVLANAFVDIGYDTTIVSKAHIIPFYPLNEKVKVIYPKTIVNYSNILTSIYGRLNLYKNLYSILKFEKPDVVISFRTITNGMVILICKALNIKVIASEHTNYKVEYNRLSYIAIKRYIYKLADVLTVLTERDKNDYYSKFLNNVVVVPNPLPLSPIKAVEEDSKKNIIISVGEVTRWKIKGFDNLVTIFSRIAYKYPDWNLVIAGAGEAEVINQMITNHKLSDRITILGEVKDIQSLMQSAKIYALTSRFEGLPMVLIEAMSQGLPCVAFDCFTGPGEIITTGVDGILTEDQNLEDFSIKLSTLIENKDLRQELGNNAIETSKKYNTPEIVAIWQRLIEN